MSEAEPLVMAFEFDNLYWNRMSRMPEVFPPPDSLYHPVVALDLHEGEKTWRWWVGNKTGVHTDLHTAQSDALKARLGIVRYQVYIESSPTNRDVFRVKLHSNQGGLVRRRVFYGENVFNYLGPNDAARHTRWYPERTDQPGPTQDDLEALHAGMQVLLARRATTCALAECFEPIKVTVHHP